jgi:hypothetical protein
MPCETCGAVLATGTEQKLRACVDCTQKILDEAQDLRNKNQELGDKNLLLEGKIEKYLSAVSEQEKIQEAQKLGDVARGRNATLEDNPYHPDSDEAASWSYGWLVSDVMHQVSRAQAVMTWSLSMLAVVHELARGGASGDEVAAKIATVIEKMEPYIPDGGEEKAQTA